MPPAPTRPRTVDFADINVPTENRNAGKGGHHLRHDSIGRNLCAGGAGRAHRIDWPRVDFLDGLIKELGAEADRAQRNRDDAGKYAWADNRHQHQRPDQRIDRTRRNNDEQRDRTHHADARCGVARGAIGHRNREHHRGSRADGGDIDGVPDRPAKGADIEPVGRHHPHSEVARLLRCVPDKGPDGLVGYQLKTPDEQSNGNQPRQPDYLLGARRAPLPRPWLCRDRGHHCTQRRK